jgi:UDP-N-acetylglucosamine 1-carboxyvinyltransferase
MDRLVSWRQSIEGSVQVRGAKNAALPQIAAALLSSERLELANVPDVIDVDTMLALMREFGVTATCGSGRMLALDARAARNAQAPYDMVRRMRASILVLAPPRPFRLGARVDAGAARSARVRSIAPEVARGALGAEVNINPAMCARQ